jgi:hypothetical protein
MRTNVLCRALVGSPNNEQARSEANGIHHIELSKGRNLLIEDQKGTKYSRTHH